MSASAIQVKRPSPIVTAPAASDQSGKRVKAPELQEYIDRLGYKVISKLPDGLNAAYLCKRENQEFVVKLSTVRHEFPQLYAENRGERLVQRNTQDQRVCKIVDSFFYGPQGRTDQIDQESGYRVEISPFIPDADDLYDSIARHAPFPLKEALRIAVEIGKAVSHLHQRGIAHKDIKPQNIILTQDRQVRLIDHEFAKLVPDGDEPLTPLGSRNFMPPELFNNQLFNNRFLRNYDSWGFGVTIYLLLTGTYPFKNKGGVDPAVNKYALGGAINLVPLPSVVNPIVRSLLARDPKDRMTVADATAQLEQLLRQPIEHSFETDDYDQLLGGLNFKKLSDLEGINSPGLYQYNGSELCVVKRRVANFSRIDGDDLIKSTGLGIKDGIVASQRHFLYRNASGRTIFRVDVYPYVEESVELFEHIAKRKLSEGEFYHYATQICQLIALIHSHNIVLRDLKLENVLINTKHNVFLVDFETAKSLPSDPGEPLSPVGSISYAPPELHNPELKSNAHLDRFDSFSLGIMFYAMIEQGFPFSGYQNSVDAIKDYAKGNKVKLAPGIDSHRIRPLILALLARNPAQRPSLQQTLSILHEKWAEYKASQAASPPDSDTAGSQESQ